MLLQRRLHPRGRRRAVQPRAARRDALAVGYSTVVLTTDSSTVSPLCAQLSPDLILLDLHMPRPDGFELLEELSPLTSGGAYAPLVPVVMISADLTDEARARALDGRQRFHRQPFNAMETSLRVRNLLRMRRLYRDVTAHNRLLEQRLRGRRRRKPPSSAAATDGSRTIGRRTRMSRG